MKKSGESVINLELKEKTISKRFKRKIIIGKIVAFIFFIIGIIFILYFHIIGSQMINDGENKIEAAKTKYDSYPADEQFSHYNEFEDEYEEGVDIFNDGQEMRVVGFIQGVATIILALILWIVIRLLEKKYEKSD